jgi:hypothetical protein
MRALWRRLSGVTSVWGLALVINPVLIYSWALLPAQVNRACPLQNLHIKFSVSLYLHFYHIFFFSRFISVVYIYINFMLLWWHSCSLLHSKGSRAGKFGSGEAFPCREGRTASDKKVFRRGAAVSFPAGTRLPNQLSGLLTSAVKQLHVIGGYHLQAYKVQPVRSYARDNSG